MKKEALGCRNWAREKSREACAVRQQSSRMAIICLPSRTLRWRQVGWTRLKTSRQWWYLAPTALTCDESTDIATGAGSLHGAEVMEKTNEGLRSCGCGTTSRGAQVRHRRLGECYGQSGKSCSVFRVVCDLSCVRSCRRERGLRLRGNGVVLSLFRADPFLLLSVHDGVIIFLVWCLVGCVTCRVVRSRGREMCLQCEGVCLRSVSCCCCAAPRCPAGVQPERRGLPVVTGTTRRISCGTPEWHRLFTKHRTSRGLGAAPPDQKLTRPPPKS